MNDPTLKSNLGAKSTRSGKGGKGETGSQPTSRRPRHLNLRALVILASLILVGSLGFYLTKNYQEHHKGPALLTQAKQFLEQKPKQPDKALVFLNRYLELNPKDMDALDLKSKVLFEMRTSPDQAAAVILPTEQVVRSDTQFTRREARRRLVRLNLDTGRPQTAHTEALKFVGLKDATPADYRLLGATLLQLGANGATTATDQQGAVVNPWDEALKNYEEAQRRDPGSAQGAGIIAYLYNRSNEPEKARQVLDKLLEVAKTDDEKALAHSLRYDFFTAANQPDLARTELDQAFQLKPNDPDILVKAAVDALRRGDIEASRKYIDSAPGQIRSDVWRIIRGEIDVSSKKIDEAIKEWREGLLATGGTNDVITWRLATVLLQLGRLSEAEPLIVQYHRLTDRAEPTPKAIYLDAFLLLQKGQAAQAIPKLEAIRFKSEDINKTNVRQGLEDGSSLGAEVAYTLGQCYESTGRDPQALDAYRDAAKIVREARGLKWAPPWLGAANVLQRANRLEDAANELVDGLITIPNDPNLLINLGRIRLLQQASLPKEQRVFTDVDKILEEARKRDPNSIELVKLQMSYLVTADRLDEAAALLASATEQKPQNPELWAFQAEVLRRLNKPQQAEEALNRGTAAVGEHAVLRMARAQLLSARGRDKDAGETLEEGVGLVPLAERPALLKALGDLRRRTDPLAARRAYAEWAKLAPQDAQPLLLMLELALMKNDEADIRATAAAIKKIGGLPELLANVFQLMKDPINPDAETKENRDKRLGEAGDIINTIIDQYPGRSVGYLLRGYLLEKLDKPDDAILAYRQARDHNGGPDALRPLFTLLARRRRFEDLKRLRSELLVGELTPDIEQIAPAIALMLGEKEATEEMVAEIVKKDPQGLNTRIFQAGALARLGEPKQAEEVLQALIQQQPDQLRPRISMLMLHISQKQPQKAAEVVEQIREHIKTEQAELFWAGCYAMIGDKAKASQYYKEALQKWPDDQNVRQDFISYFLATGNADEAEAALRDLLKRDPKHAWARRELAQLLSTHRSDPTAWSEALELIGDKPSDSDTAEDRLVRATVLSRAPNRDRTQEAIRILEDLVAAESNGTVNMMAHEVLARIYIDTKQLAKARTHAQAAADRSNDPNVIAFYTDLLLYDKHPDEAAKQLVRLTQLEPDTMRTLGLRAQLLQVQGHGSEAATLLENAFASVDKSPDGENAGRQIIQLMLQLNQLDAAERAGRRLAELWPKSSWILSLVLFRQNKVEEALKFCQASVEAGAPFDGGSTAATLVIGKPLEVDAEARLKQAESILNAAIKQLPNNFALLFSQASVLRAQGRYADAIQLYRDLLTQNPDNFPVLNNMAWTLSEDLNQPAQGLEFINNAINRANNQPGALSGLLDTRGVILTRLNKLDQAISDLEIAVKKAPTAAYYYHLARAYHEAGRTAEFQKYRTLAKETGLDPTMLQPNERPEMDKLMNH